MVITIQVKDASSSCIYIPLDLKPEICISKTEMQVYLFKVFLNQSTLDNNTHHIHL